MRTILKSILGPSVRWEDGIGKRAFALALTGLALAATDAVAQKSQLAERRFALAVGTTPPVVDAGSVYFVGNATVILRYAGYTILTDPNFLPKGDRVQLGFGVTTERLTNPALDLAQLPPIDLIVLSQLHADHFDELVQQKLDRNIPIVSTPAAIKQLRKLGFKSLHPLDKWQVVNVVKGDWQLRITAMPARRGPPGVARALPEVMGSMLEFQTPNRSTAYRVYISGDTLLYDDLKENPRVFRDVDLALLHLGGARALGLLLTMDALQGVRALALVNPDVAIPVHYDDYPIFKSPLEDFLQAAREAGLEQKVKPLKRGETFQFRIPSGRLK